MKPTKETYSELDRAYSYFNKHLFGDALPDCVITVQRHKGAYGYFWGNTWSDQTGKIITDEIALNPDHFKTRSIAESLSTLVHEMCHLQQHHFGKPSRNGYHNQEWARMMEDAGLIASDTGETGGKKTGQTVSHYIDKGGVFDKACTKLLNKGFTIPWVALTDTNANNANTRRKKAASKTKYTCPHCELNAWAKPEVTLICGECNTALECA